jgi:filamentous hemagglutinin family protein
MCKPKRRKIPARIPSSVAIAVAACFAGSLALANPTNPTVVHGTATFQQAGNILNITNSANAIINWGSFSISVGELTRFIQPSALSAVLNRVTGQDPSVILGALQSNGRVFLINPNGIVFGAGAQVDVAGLVASTLKLSNEDFLNNRLRFTDGIGAGSVVNQGQITGGSVYLVGNAVTNNGLITSPNGEVVLAAGNSVELVNPGTPNLRVEITAPENEARNLGTISAEAGRIGIYAGLIKQSGAINADSAVAEGGRIMLKASKGVTLEATSNISARGTDGGRIEVLADLQTGTTSVAGTLDVSANGSGVGRGGFVETSAGNVQIGESTRVHSKGSNDGANGLWLIDPVDFTISSGGAGQTSSGIGADTLMSNLNNPYGGDITIATALGVGLGDITVAAPVSWSGTSSLTLLAHNDVKVDNSISNAGTGTVNLVAGWTGADPVFWTVTPGTGDVLINAPVSSGGNILITAGRDITVNQNLSANAAALGMGVSISLDAGRHITVTGATVFAAGGASAAYGGGTGTVSLLAANDLTVTNSSIEVRGGDVSDTTLTYEGGSAYLYLESTSGTTKLSASDVMSIGGSATSGSASGGFAWTRLRGASVEVENASFVRAEGGAGGGTGSGDAIVTLVSELGGTTISNAFVSAMGGENMPGLSRGYADVEINSNGAPLSVSSSTISAVGGSYAQVTLYGNGGITLNSSTVSAIAPTGADGSDGYIGISSNAAIDFGSSTVSAVGIAQAEGGEGCCNSTGVSILSGGGDITLGQVTSSDWVRVSTPGAIIDGNVGLNIGALQASLAGTDGIGSVTNPLETQVAALDVYASYGGIGIINSGDLALGGTSLCCTNGLSSGSGNVAIGATGNLIVVDGAEGVSAWGGNLLLAANGNIGIYSGVYAAGRLDLQAGGSISIGDTSAFSQASAIGSNGVNAVAGGSLTLNPNVNMTPSELKSFGGNTVVTTGGDVVVNYSRIIGDPDVIMTPGGTVQINGVSGNPGSIDAVSPTSIYLTFPNGLSGGFIINGVSGVVYDSATLTGFTAGGQPVVPGVNFVTTYLGSGSTSTSITVPTQNLIVAANSSTKPPDPEKDKDVFEEIKDEKRKDAPVCR